MLCPCAVLVATVNHLPHDLGHERLCVVSSYLHLLMAHLYGLVFQAEVGDDTDTAGLDAAVMSYTHFGNGAHAHSIASETVIHFLFCWGLKGGTLHTEVHAVNQTDAFLLSYLIGFGNEMVVIGLVHVGETRTGGEVFSAQRVFGEEVDMVGDDHEIADFKLRVHSSRGVGDKERLDTQFVHHANGEGHLLHRVALIIMETSLHRHDILVAKFSEDQFSTVSFHRRYGEVGDVAVRELVGVSYF